MPAFLHNGVHFQDRWWFVGSGLVNIRRHGSSDSLIIRDIRDAITS